MHRRNRAPAMPECTRTARLAGAIPVKLFFSQPAIFMNMLISLLTGKDIHA